MIRGTRDVDIDNKFLKTLAMKLSNRFSLTTDFPLLSRNRSTDQNNPFNEDREATSARLVY